MEGDVRTREIIYSTSYEQCLAVNLSYLQHRLFISQAIDNTRYLQHKRFKLFTAQVIYSTRYLQHTLFTAQAIYSTSYLQHKLFTVQVIYSTKLQISSIVVALVA